MSAHTIGEVLNRLKDEFEDVSISKIRYLEAEGLISPDRTESGYRRFTEADVDRLRYVLRAQRDRYLPLKVIRDELARLDAGLPVANGAGTGGGEVDDTADAGASPAAGAGAGAAADPRRLLASDPDDVALSPDELQDASGLNGGQLDQLREHGLLGGGPSHDADDLRIAKLAATLLGNGLEPRHLRMYRQFAEREASLAEQLVAPLLRQRNPDSRRSATERAEQLAKVGRELHTVLLAAELRTLLRS